MSWRILLFCAVLCAVSVPVQATLVMLPLGEYNNLVRSSEGCSSGHCPFAKQEVHSETSFPEKPIQGVVSTVKEVVHNLPVVKQAVSKTPCHRVSPCHSPFRKLRRFRLFSH